jgi:hypothetical protein
LHQLQRIIPGINYPCLHVGGTDGPSPFMLRMEHSRLYSLEYLHAGAPKFWVVVPPSEQQQLERRLLEHNEGRHPPCSQFVRHMSVWVPVEALEHWGIRYVGVEQRCGELVVVAPGAYHQGWNSGWNVAEAVAYADGHSRSRARNCRPCSPQLCEVDPIPMWPTDSAERDGAVGAAVEMQRETSLRQWKAPDDSPFRARVAQSISVNDLLRPEKNLSAEEVRSLIAGSLRTALANREESKA